MASQWSGAIPGWGSRLRQDGDALSLRFPLLAFLLVPPASCCVGFFVVRFIPCCFLIILNEVFIF